MKNKTINMLRQLAEIANDLDTKGLKKEANVLTNVMVRVSQTGISLLDNGTINPVKSNVDKIDSSLLAERKESGQYTASTDNFQNTIDYAVKNKLTLRQMYDYVFKNRGGNYANNMIAKYRTIHPDPDTALVQPTRLS